MNDSKFKESNGKADLTHTTTKRVKSLESLIEECEIDTSVWSVKEWECNKKDNNSGRPLYQIKAKLVRRFSVRQEMAADELFKRLAKLPKPTVRTPKPRGDNLLELCLFDTHLGKYAWGLETGTNQDTKIQKDIFLEAAAKLLARSNDRYDRIMIPIGNDFFQVDNWLGTTEAGTHVDNDGRYCNVFTAGCESVITLVNWCLGVAPVDLVWIPGNHDPSTSYHMACAVMYRFFGNKNLRVDIAPPFRKYYRYGSSLIGLTHGNLEKTEDLPILMAQEMPKDWAETTCHEWHLGHLHTKKEYTTPDVNESKGVRMRFMSSISGTDSWHFRHGYVGNSRAAEAYTFNKVEGYLGHQEVSV